MRLPRSFASISARPVRSLRSAAGKHATERRRLPAGAFGSGAHAGRPSTYFYVLRVWLTLAGTSAIKSVRFKALEFSNAADGCSGHGGRAGLVQGQPRAFPFPLHQLSCRGKRDKSGLQPGTAKAQVGDMRICEAHEVHLTPRGRADGDAAINSRSAIWRTPCPGTRAQPDEPTCSSNRHRCQFRVPRRRERRPRHIAGVVSRVPCSFRNVQAFGTDRNT